jgi:hypothetical protein
MDFYPCFKKTCLNVDCVHSHLRLIDSLNSFKQNIYEIASMHTFVVPKSAATLIRLLDSQQFLHDSKWILFWGDFVSLAEAANIKSVSNACLLYLLC